MHWSYKTTSMKATHDYPVAMNLKATSHAYPIEKYSKLMKPGLQKKVLCLKLP